MEADVIQSHPDGVLITVWVVPGAHRTEVDGLHGDAIRIRVAAAARGDMANEALTRHLRGLTGASGVEILQGRRSRCKIVLLRGMEKEQMRGFLAL